jgi:hypothetical protein
MQWFGIHPIVVKQRLAMNLAVFVAEDCPSASIQPSSRPQVWYGS